MVERTLLSQRLWWVNWTIVLVGCLVQFLPLFIHADQLHKGYPVGIFAFIPKCCASALSSDGTIDTEDVLAITGKGYFDQVFDNTYTVQLFLFFILFCLLLISLFSSYCPYTVGHLSAVSRHCLTRNP